jgi:hypothetical protein
MSVQDPAYHTRHTHTRQRRPCRLCLVYHQHLSCNISGAQLLRHPLYPPRPPLQYQEQLRRNQQTRKARKGVQRLDVRARPMSLRHASTASERTSVVTINGRALAVWHLGNR